MSREKQIEEQAIEEMARVIETTEQIARDAHCGLPSPRMYAKDLYWHGYRKQSEWISVEERLPEDSMTVITCNAKGEVDADYYAFYSLGFTDKTVTHWMPLPEPPEKGGAK
jgi:hypothetical protein